MKKDNLCRAVHHLESAGHKVSFAQEDACWGIAVCEALNLLAKTDDAVYYELKAACLKEATQLLGCTYGWDRGDSDCLYLAAQGIGTAAFHLKSGISNLPRKMWPAEWSGIRRQKYAFDTLSKAALRPVLQKYSTKHFDDLRRDVTVENFEAEVLGVLQFNIPDDR